MMNLIRSLNSQDLFACLSAVGAIGALIVSTILYQLTKRRDKLQNLAAQANAYFTPEMMLAIQALWDLYLKEGDGFIKRYFEIKAIDDARLKSLDCEDRIEYARTTLHCQRRLVTSFWRGLGLLMRSGLLPLKEVYGWWNQDNVAIIEKILIPIESAISDRLHLSKFNPNTDALYFPLKNKNKFYK